MANESIMVDPGTYRVLALQSAMSINIKTGMIPTRGYTKTRMVATANGYSGYAKKDIVGSLKALVIWFESETGKENSMAGVLASAGIVR